MHTVNTNKNHKPADKDMIAKQSMRVLRVWCIVILLFLLSGCANTKEYYYFFRGNRSYVRGSYSEALRYYLLANANENPFVMYNLGLVYVALGELESAHHAWHIAESSSNSVLTARAFFNNGILYYQEAEFTKAYESFKEAIQRNPVDIETKRYLEQAYQRISNDEQLPESEISVSQETKEYARILDYIQRIEMSQFDNDVSQEEQDIYDW